MAEVPRLFLNLSFSKVNSHLKNDKFKNIFLKKTSVLHIPGLTVVVFDMQIGQSRKRFGTS